MNITITMSESARAALDYDSHLMWEGTLAELLPPDGADETGGLPTDEALLEILFERFNIGPVPAGTHASKSLSVGDFVKLNKRLYRCENMGWKLISN